MYCMMCIIHAGARYDSGYSCLPPGGFSELFISLFCDCVKLSNVFVFQVQCQLHPSASRSKYFLLLSSPALSPFAVVLFLFLPSSSCLTTELLLFFSSFVSDHPSLFSFFSSVSLPLLPSSLYFFLFLPFSHPLFSFFLFSHFFLLLLYSSISFSFFSFLLAQLFLSFFLPIRSSSLPLQPLVHVLIRCFPSYDNSIVVLCLSPAAPGFQTHTVVHALSRRSWPSSQNTRANMLDSVWTLN